MDSRRGFFAAVAAVVVLFMAASSAPTPLYVVYQQLWGFTPTVLTVVFAIYVFGLLASLLVVGSLSDHIGRRPVLAGAIVLEAVALVLFVLAGDVVVLSAARLLQGIATGAAITTLGAALTDLERTPGRAGLVNSLAAPGGLALGALGCGVLVQYGPEPTRFVYALLIGGMGAAAVIVALMPETAVLADRGGRRPAAVASLRPVVGVPAHLRADLVPIVPVLVASWALTGLYLSLGPSVVAAIFGLHDHVAGGLVVTLFCGAGAVTAFLVRRRSALSLLAPSAALLGAGTLTTVVAVSTNLLPLAALGTLVAGTGFGAAALATFGTFARIAAPHERGALLAVAFTVAYLAFSVPALVAGFASTAFGLRATAEVYALVIVALTIAALVLRLRRPALQPTS
ncbi:MFS transporter [Pseudonocardia ailaonensis]|uniref:MFS transporter n=1 Tax=Pseudonocardia ailaonensis TaxID=367279 RepID=A0ABN2MQJ7_9PSEU